MQYLHDYFDDSRIIKDACFKNIAVLLRKFVPEDTLSYIGDEKHISELDNNPNINAVICSADIASKISERYPEIGVVISDNPRIELVKLHNRLSESEEYVGKPFKTVIGKNCNISPMAYIAEYNVRIGDNTTVGPFTCISDADIGNNCMIYANCMIGGTGFEFKRCETGIIPVIHTGRVSIGDRVHILSLTNVSRAIYTWDRTRIGDDCKIDVLVHIAHAAKLGKRVMVAAGGVVAGSSCIEDDSWIGVNASVRDQIHVGKNTRVSIGAVATLDVPDNITVSGNFAMEHSRFIEKIKKERALFDEQNTMSSGN